MPKKKVSKKVAKKKATKKKATKKNKVESPFEKVSRTTFECDDSDFNALVREYFKGQPFVSREDWSNNFSFSADQLVGHDATVSFSADGDYDEGELEDVFSGERYEWCSDILLNKMVADGFLPAGDYYIKTY